MTRVDMTKTEMPAGNATRTRRGAVRGRDTAPAARGAVLVPDGSGARLILDRE